MELKIERPFQENYWKNLYNDNNINFGSVYKKQICDKLFDKQIAEFNFKILHLILPCWENLTKWKITDSRMCKICGVTHNVQHLLFECEKSKSIWQHFTLCFKETVDMRSIAFGEKFEKNSSFFISLLSFYIYKEWNLYKSDTEEWKRNDIINFVKRNLKVKNDIYSGCSDKLTPILELINKFNQTSTNTISMCDCSPYILLLRGITPPTTSLLYDIHEILI